MSTKNLASILRKTKRGRRWADRRYYNFGPVSSWLGSRKVDELGSKYYFFVAKKRQCQWTELYEVSDAYQAEGFIDGFQPAWRCGERWVPVEGGFRQDRKLNDKEVEFLSASQVGCNMRFWISHP